MFSRPSCPDGALTIVKSYSVRLRVTMDGLQMKQPVARSVRTTLAIHASRRRKRTSRRCLRYCHLPPYRVGRRVRSPFLGSGLRAPHVDDGTYTGNRRLEAGSKYRVG